ncbi:nuclear transport factor 2 family protein [Kribbella sp. NPDC048915]|uniref:nuclear transport factor 2 family protein n=1 Tax=Kribbella sp. NPDC048915 TaxID=3155148 RepID=UPI0033E142A9
MNATALADQYFALWNAADADRRAELLADHWTADATFQDPSFDAAGHDELNKLIGATQQMFPGLRFARIGDINEHHGYLRWSWHLGAEGQEPVAGGTDIVVLSSDDKIQKLIGFHDFAPAH